MLPCPMRYCLGRPLARRYVDGSRYPMELAQIDKIIRSLATRPASDLETQQLEFKGWCRNEKDLSKEISEAAVCLANSEGGLLVLGVDDKGARAIRPCPHPTVTPTWVRKKIRDLTKPPVDAQVFRVGDELPALSDSAAADVIVVEVKKTTNPSGHRTHRGVNLVRVDTECRVEYLVGSDDYTSVPLHHLSISSLDEGSIGAALQQREKSFPQLVDKDLLPADHLQGVGLLCANSAGAGRERARLVPSLAALLLLGKTEQIKNELRYAETVFSVDTAALSPLTSTNSFNVLVSLQRYSQEITRHLDAQRSMIPAETIRELLLNAYIHRCYRTTAPVHNSYRGERN